MTRRVQRPLPRQRQVVYRACRPVIEAAWSGPRGKTE